MTKKPKPPAGPKRIDVPDGAVLIPVKTVPGLNAREAWRVRATRVKKERGTAKLAIGPKARTAPLPLIVTMTRVSAGELDSDNLQGALKGIRDGIADAYGVDDRTPLIEWRYAQRKCKRGVFGVIVEVERVEP